MKIATLLVLILLTAVHCIQYGTDVLSITQYPFYVMLGNPHICGGTLLSYDPAYVLTAAHCVADGDPQLYRDKESPYFVNYNHVARDKQRAIGMVDWTVHPLYNVSGTVNMNYDVAIARLAQPMRKTANVKRVALWSPSMNTSLPSRGELIGMGFTGYDASEAKQLQRLALDITRFNPSGHYNIEAKSDTEEHIACHGDSGSPLVVYHTVPHPSGTKNVSVPFVVGNLARIFGAYDISPTKLTCPLPHKIGHSFNSLFNTVVESFCNLPTMMDWIANVTSMTTEQLTDPFYNPPHPACKSCKLDEFRPGDNHSVITSYDDDDDIDKEDKGNNKEEEIQWRIGVAVDGLLNDTQHIWIGALNVWREAGPSTNSASRLSFTLLYTFVLFIFKFT